MNKPIKQRFCDLFTKHPRLARIRMHYLNHRPYITLCKWPSVPRCIASMILITLTTTCFAQKKKHKLPKATIVVGKVLNSRDSIAIEYLFFEGLRQKVNQKPLSASDHFKRVLDIDPANDAAMYELALIYNTPGKPVYAEELMQKAVAVKPDNKWYWLLLENIYTKTENITQLAYVYDELIRLNPDSQEYYLAKGSNLIMQNKLNEASLLYKAIEDRFGTSDDITQIREQTYQQSGESQKAIAYLEKQIQKAPRNGNNYAYLAAIYTKLGNRDKAISLLVEAKKADPKNTLIRISLAENYSALNRFEDAFIELKVAFTDRDLSIDTKINVIISLLATPDDIKSLAAAEELAAITLRTHPDDAKAYAIYGDLLSQKQDYSGALKTYQDGLTLNNQLYALWEQVVRIEIIQGNFKQAVADGEKALSLFPNQVNLHLLTGIAYTRIPQLEQAVTHLQTALDLKPTDKNVLIQIYTTLGDSFNMLKRFAKSDQAYDKALEIDPANSYVLNNYAYFLSERNTELDKAAKMSQYAIELEPNNASLEDTYAWILFKKKNYADARLWIERAIQNDKNNSATLFEHYGDILYHLNEKKQALAQWKKAKDAGENNKKLEIKIKGERYVK